MYTTVNGRRVQPRLGHGSLCSVRVDASRCAVAGSRTWLRSALCCGSARQVQARSPSRPLPKVAEGRPCGRPFAFQTKRTRRSRRTACRGIGQQRNRNSPAQSRRLSTGSRTCRRNCSGFSKSSVAYRVISCRISIRQRVRTRQPAATTKPLPDGRQGRPPQNAGMGPWTGGEETGPPYSQRGPMAAVGQYAPRQNGSRAQWIKTATSICLSRRGDKTITVGNDRPA